MTMLQMKQLNVLKIKLMCFYMTKESKVLVAKRNIKVYKIGTYADNDSFNPFFHNNFTYSVNQIVFEKVKFTNMIAQGLHSYLVCELVPFALNVNLYSCRNLISHIFLQIYTVYLGEFIIPKGATYCLNNNGEVVSNNLMYTGNYIKIVPGKEYDTKKLWKEKQVKYLLIMVKSIKQYQVMGAKIVILKT